jgi:endonuclease III related protein
LGTKRTKKPASKRRAPVRPKGKPAKVPVRKPPPRRPEAPRYTEPTSRELLDVYRLLRERFGHRKWWPGETPFEVCVGAILTQNTAWQNVEKAIANLKAAGLMDARKLHAAGVARIAELIRPAGYFNVKARRLHSFLTFLVRGHRGDVKVVAEIGLPFAREILLGVNGVGKETADSMLLYAMGLPAFVVDAYTKRIFSRMGHIRPIAEYDEVQALFQKLLPEDAPLYNDYHAQIVELGKRCCRKSNPRCGECPVVNACEYGREESA